jgi:hypothetical protein
MSAMNDRARHSRALWWLVATAALVGSCARDIPLPPPRPDAHEGGPSSSPDGSVTADAPLIKDAPRNDAPAVDVRPGDGATADLGTLPGPPDGPLASDAPDGPLPCVPDCSATEACMNGQCVSLCNPDEAVCASGCADLMSDAKNCGKCDMPCPTGQFCSNGACAKACGAGETRCGQSCVKLESNAKNCGFCGTACAGAQACVQSACTCVAPNQTCGGSCQSLKNNRKNCGRCDNACSGDFVCNGTTCGCPSGRKRCPNKNSNTCVASLDDCCASGQAWCDNVGNGSCVSIQTDETHCGGCNKPACPGAQRCAGGKCGCPALQPHACNDGTCLPNGTCCSNETACPGQATSCVAKGACCPDKPNRCPGQDLCVSDLADCCPGKKHCGGGVCVNNDECCGSEVKCARGNADGSVRCVAQAAACCDGATEDFCPRSKACIPKGGCCENGQCTGGQVCNDSSACACPSGTMICGSGATLTCVKTGADACCAESDCNPGATGRTCQNNRCQCPGMHRACGGNCCEPGKICVDPGAGTCGEPPPPVDAG